MGVEQIRRERAGVEAAREVNPARDALVDDQGGLVGVGGAAQQDAGTQSLVARGQIQFRGTDLRSGLGWQRSFFPSAAR